MHLEDLCEEIVQSSYHTLNTFLICWALAFPKDQAVRFLSNFWNSTCISKEESPKWLKNLIVKFEHAEKYFNWYLLAFLLEAWEEKQTLSFHS